MTDTTTPSVKQGWLRALIFVPIWFTLTALLSIITDGIVVKLGGGHSKPFGGLDPFSESIMLVPQMLSVVVSIYICRRWLDRKDFQSLGVFPRWKETLFGALFGVILISVACGFMVFMGWVELRYQSFDSTNLLGFVLLFVLVAINEEMLCRTYFLSSLMDSFNKYVALLIVSLLFGVLHIFNPDFTWLGFFEISLAGVLLGLWYIYRRNIWFPIGLHFTWNFFQGPIFGFEVSGNPVQDSVFLELDKAETLLSGGAFGLEGSLAGVAITLIGSIGLFLYLQRNKGYS